MGLIAEEAHEAGRDGVADVKRWLEATMRFEVRYTVYDQPVRVTVPLLNGSQKRFDMLAQHYEDDRDLTASGRDVYVEVKNVHTLSTARKQVAQYKAFVATAHSATQAATAIYGRDPRWDFMFATTHPWEIEHFLSLTTKEFVKEACERNANLFPKDHVVSDTAAQDTADRLWVWLIPKRQDEMTMGNVHRGYVFQGIMGARG